MTFDEFYTCMIMMGYKPYELDREPGLLDPQFDDMVVFPRTATLPIRVAYNRVMGSAVAYRTISNHVDRCMTKDLQEVLEYVVAGTYR